jgi:hypothetical protein
MDIASILNELWRRRWWMALGILVAGAVAATTVFELPSFEKKVSGTGVARADVLIDTQHSALGSIEEDVSELVTRASIYSRMFGSTEVKKRIADAMDVPVEQIGVLDQKAVEAGITDVGGGLLVGGSTQESHPVVRIGTQAPSMELAERLASVSREALIGYVAELQRETDVPPRDRVVMRELGAPQGDVITTAASYKNAVGAFIGILLAWALLVLVVARTIVALRELRAAEKRDTLTELWELDIPPEDDDPQGVEARQGAA